MGDHSCKLHITFDIHGKKYEFGPAYINYSGFDGPDRRVMEFFEESWNDAYSRYEDMIAESEAEQNKARREREEREELARLKQKYEPSQGSVGDVPDGGK